jgi:hypothetical protein
VSQHAPTVVTLSVAHIACRPGEGLVGAPEGSRECVITIQGASGKCAPSEGRQHQPCAEQRHRCSTRELGERSR